MATKGPSAREVEPSSIENSSTASGSTDRDSTVREPTGRGSLDHRGSLDQNKSRFVSASVDHLFRSQAGQMVSTLTRILGFENLDLAEDVVQDAMVQALRRWPYHGLPENPSAWIVQVAKNRALDRLRRDSSWRDKSAAVQKAFGEGSAIDRTHGPSDGEVGFASELLDDQLRMIFACCHPGLGRDAQVALTLKTIGGFSVAELGRAFLVPEPTMAQRLVRAKRRLRKAQVQLVIPEPAALPERLDAVLEVLYLMFNEGYGAGEGEDLVRSDLCGEALRLSELLTRHPQTTTPKAHALAALMAFLGARLPTRLDPTGDLWTLAHQDRSRWDRRLIARGAQHLGKAASGHRLSTYHLEAEIAARHTAAPSFEATDWRRILSAYDALLVLNPSPIVALNRLVAVAEVRGAEVALAEAESLIDEPALEGYPPAWAIRGELLARIGRTEGAAECFDRAIGLYGSQPVRRHLEKRRREVLA